MLKFTNKYWFNKKNLVNIILCLLAILSLCLNGRSVFRYLKYSHYKISNWTDFSKRDTLKYLCDSKKLFDKYIKQNDSVFLVVDNRNSLRSIERTLHITLSNYRLPSLINYGTLCDVNDEDFILIKGFYIYYARTDIDKLILNKYVCLEVLGEYSLLVRKDRYNGIRCKLDLDREWDKIECVGVFIFIIFTLFSYYYGGLLLVLFSLFLTQLILLGCLVSHFLPNSILTIIVYIISIFLSKLFLYDNLFIKEKCEKYKTIKTLFLLVFLGCIVFIAVSHGLEAPNGLGISGGRAKIWFLYKTFPPSFFTGIAFSTFQPTYPPGMALTTLSTYCITNYPGEWLTALLGCIIPFMLFSKLFNTCNSFFEVLFVSSIMFSPIVFRLSSFYYSELAMLLCVICGLDVLIRKGFDSSCAWFIVGISAWYKNEGFIYTIALWISIILLRKVNIYKMTKGLFIALFFPILWFVFCRCLGGELAEYNALFNLNFSNIEVVFKNINDNLIFHSWEYSFIPIIVLVHLCISIFQRNKKDVLPIIFFLISILFIVIVYLHSTNPYIEWHVRSSINRLLFSSCLIYVYYGLKTKLFVFDYYQ